MARATWSGAARLIAVLLLVLQAVACRQSPLAYQPPSDLSAAIDALFEDYTAPGSPGVAVMVIHDGEVRHLAGYGLASVEAATPITGATAFRLASVSKQFFAMAVMILAEGGSLSYDDPVTRFLPELERFGDQLTVRHLLNHTGGLSDYYEELEEHYADGPMPTNDETLLFMAEHGESLFAPGERYEYSNPGYEMLSLIIQRAGGRPAREFLAEKIFEPLEMADTVVRDATEPEIANRALGYSRVEGELKLDDDHRLNHIIGSGAVYSTLEDLYLWDQALYTEQLVSRQTLEEAFSPARLTSGETYPYGFGWRLGDYGALGPRLAHSGGWVGFSTHITRYPERRFSVVVLSNLSDFDGYRMTHRVVDLYFPSRLIRGSTVVDGTGAPGRVADVRIEGDRIVAIGELEPGAGDLVVDGDGRVLAPGFIDPHSHADSTIDESRQAMAAVSQGITTVVGGQDGSSRLPLGELFEVLEERPAAVNLASFAGHGTLRQEIMGEDFRRQATAKEIAAMVELLERELEAGALGLASGLEYDPGIYSSTDEVMTLARVAATVGGSYISHIRSEDRRFWPAIDEILTIGREAALPVQISHIKLAMASQHGRADELLAKLDEARTQGIEVTADIYPYTYWQSDLSVMFPDRDFEDPVAAAFAVEELSRPEDMQIPVFVPDPDLAGMTLAEIAEVRGTDPATTLIDLLREAEKMRAGLTPEERMEAEVDSVIAVSMSEEDIERLMAWPHTSICTDGELAGAHPRGFGAFPRVLGRYVREREVLTLEDAIYKMTGATAARMGIEGRGTIEPGNYADLVLFDPQTVLDVATTDDPHAKAVGIDHVWVNGRLVYEKGEASGRRPGRIMRRHDTGPRPQTDHHEEQP